MRSIHIVTDSGACFGNPRLLQQYPYTVIPYTIEIGGVRYQEGRDLSTEDAMSMIRQQKRPITVTAPSAAQFAALYSRLSHHYEAIVSIHSSRELTDSWANGRQAALQVRESIAVAVVDSQSICGGQGMLVRVAGEAIARGLSFDDVVQKVRGAVERIYAMYSVDSLEALRQNDIMSPSRSILGAYLGIRALLSIEEGRVSVTEKVRSRSQAIERLVEFITEFDALEDALILQNKPGITEQARSLQDRLSQEFLDRHFPFVLYQPSLAAFVGTDATGIVVLEKDPEEDEDVSKNQSDYR